MRAALPAPYGALVNRKRVITCAKSCYSVEGCTPDGVTACAPVFAPNTHQHPSPFTAGSRPTCLLLLSAIPKNIAQIRKQTEALQLRVDTNESIFVQKAIAIKGLRIAIEEKDSEIRSLKRKVTRGECCLFFLLTIVGLAYRSVDPPPPLPPLQPSRRDSRRE